MDTTIYLDYLANRFDAGGGINRANVRFEELEEIDPQFDLVINCAGIGARELVQDVDLEPHRGQVAIVPRIENLSCAIVCDDAPLMYAIPRANDCLFGGTNDLSSDLAIDPETTKRIVAECSRVLKIDNPLVLAERVGLRPFRRSGVRLEREQLRDGRTVIHNYGHGGSGFTLSWGCAREVPHDSRRNPRGLNASNEQISHRTVLALILTEVVSPLGRLASHRMVGSCLVFGTPLDGCSTYRLYRICRPTRPDEIEKLSTI